MSNDTFEAFFVNENEKVKNSCPLGVKLPSRVYRYCKYAYISIYLFGKLVLLKIPCWIMYSVEYLIPIPTYVLH